MHLISTNIFETIGYPNNTMHWLSFHACQRKTSTVDMTSGTSTETTTDLVIISVCFAYFLAKQQRVFS